jgi:arylsulfatase A-like enzyme
MASHDSSRPNIVFVLTDDQGAWALGGAGNDEVITPHLDHLAATGMRYDHFFCASPVCSPARASILTGLMPSQHGVHDWIRKGSLEALEGGGWDDDRRIEYLQGVLAYTDLLAAQGYVCGLSGKWHLGDSLRPQKGFGSWHVFPWGGGDYNNAYILREGRLERDPRYLSEVITEGGLRFLEAQGRSDAPFYLGVHYTAPHSPWDRGQHPEELVALYAECAFRSCPEVSGGHPWQINSAPRGRGARRHELLSGYYAAITGVDKGVGQLVAKLDELGLRENTLFLFSSDNGMNMGHHGIWGKGNGTFPQNMYDTSVQVPMIIAQPGRVPAGVVCHDLASHVDLFPTLLDVARVANPSAAALPGHSLAPLWRGEAVPEREEVVVMDEYGPVRMIRTQHWKYVHRYPYGPHELYDLRNDPQEEANLADDAGYRARREEMRARLEVWFLRYSDPALDGTREAVTGKGQVERVGLGGQGRAAFAQDWWYINEDGSRRADQHRP